MSIHSSLAKETGFPEISGIRGSRIRNTAQGIRNPTNDRNRESKFHRQRTRIRCLKIRNPLRGVQNPRLPWIPLHGANTLTLMHEQIVWYKNS